MEIANTTYDRLTPRDFISLRIYHEKFENIKKSLKEILFTDKVDNLMTDLNFLKYAFKADLDAAYEFGLIGGHQILLKLLMKYNDYEEILSPLGDVIEACTSSCLQFPIKSSTTIKFEERRVPLKIMLDTGNINNFGNSDDRKNSSSKKKEILLRTIPKDINEIASSNKANLTVGYYLWDASIAMAYWLVKNSIFFKNKKVLEIGCGAGLVGIVAASYASRVYMCDFNLKIIENVSYNIKLNSKKAHSNNKKQYNCCCVNDDMQVKGVAFDWETVDFSIYKKDGLKKESMDVILGADVICQESDCYNIARVLKYYLTKDTGVAYFLHGTEEHRFGVEKFATAMQSEGFNVVNMDDVINENGEYQTFIASNRHFNSRPLDKYKMFKVTS